MSDERPADRSSTPAEPPTQGRGWTPWLHGSRADRDRHEAKPETEGNGEPGTS